MDIGMLCMKYRESFTLPIPLYPISKDGQMNILWGGKVKEGNLQISCKTPVPDLKNAKLWAAFVKNW